MHNTFFLGVLLCLACTLSLFYATSTAAVQNVFAAACALWVRAFNALTLLVGWQEGHLACKKNWVVGCCRGFCLERGADLHMVQLLPLSLTVSFFSKSQIGFTFLVQAHPGSPGQRVVKRVCVCVCCALWVKFTYWRHAVLIARIRMT